MQNRIAYHIISLLYLNGKVRIPGVGRIVQKPQKAALEKDSLAFRPPQITNLFEEDKQSKNRLLERFIAYKANTSRTRARRELARFGNEIKTGIKKEGRVELKYLGTLSSQGDALQFAPNEALLNPGHSVLKHIPLPTPLTRVEEPESLPYAALDVALPVTDATQEFPAVQQEERVEEESGQQAPVESITEVPEYHMLTPQPIIVEPLIPEEKKEEPVEVVVPVMPTIVNQPIATATRAPKKDPRVTPKEKKPWPIAIPIAALILLGLLVGAFLFYQSRLSHQPAAVVPDTTIITEQETPIAIGEETTSQSDNIEDQEEITNTPTEGDTKIALGDTGMHDDVESIKSAPTPANEQVKSTESIESPPVVRPALPEQSTHIATGDCLIVLGAFSQHDNTDRMLQRLQAMGYTTVTNPREQLTQVAVPVDCKAQNLNVVLDFLRKNIEEKAWVMRPK